MMHTNAKVTPINNNDYSCHITAVDLFNQSYEVHVTSQVINRLGGGHTHKHTCTHTHTHIQNPHRNNFKKPGAPAAWFKKPQLGHWRMTTNLSYPEGVSVADAIDAKPCSLSYKTVNKVDDSTMQLDKALLVAKVDIKSAYHLIPVYPCDHHFLGISWQFNIFVDAMLPLELSVPQKFTAIADAFEWCIIYEDVKHVFQYLDDFVVLGPQTQQNVMNHFILFRKLQRKGNFTSSRQADGPTYHRDTFLAYCDRYSL